MQNSSKQTNRRRRGNYSLHYTMIGFVALVIFLILSVTIFFNIDTVVITGNSIYSPDEIITVSGIKSGNNMIRKNMSRCSNNIESELVYIEIAEVKRSFPSTVKITITPCIETANLIQDDGCYLISQSGKILNISDTPAQNVLTIYGTEPKENLMLGDRFESEDTKKTESIYDLIDRSQSSLLAGKLNEFDISDRLNASCIYDNRIKIELGSVSELDYKFKFAYTILTQKIGNKTEGTLKMLSGSATFIDKDGLKANEAVYLNNIEAAVTAEQEEDVTEVTEQAMETTKTVVNFE